MSEDLRFPIGEFEQNVSFSSEKRKQFVKTIENLPVDFRKAVSGLSLEQLKAPYRPGGWTLQQLVHHVADSHMNSFIRFKLALTEDAPTIKTYDEGAWAETADVKNVQIESSLTILDGVHARWAMLLKSMGETDFDRVVHHPERGGMTLHALLALYDWHSRHHTAHVLRLRERMKW